MTKKQRNTLDRLEQKGNMKEYWEVLSDISEIPTSELKKMKVGNRGPGEGVQLTPGEYNRFSIFVVGVPEDDTGVQQVQYLRSRRFRERRRQDVPDRIRK